MSAAAVVGSNRPIPFVQHPNHILDQVIAIAQSIQQLVGDVPPEFWSFSLDEESTEQYYQWKGELMQRDVYPIIPEDLNDHEGFELFLCPLSFDLIECPVKIPISTPDERTIDDGNIWEKATVIEHLQGCIESGIVDERTHPNRACVITKESLKYDPLYHSSLIEVIKKVLREARVILTGNQEEILKRAKDPVQLMQRYLKETPPEGWSVSLVIRVLENMRNTLMEKAARLLEEEERTFDRISDAGLKYTYLYEIVLTRIQWNDYAGALNMLNKVLEIAKAIKDLREQCNAFTDIAAGYIELGDKRGARKALEWAKNAAYKTLNEEHRFFPRSKTLEKIVELLIKLEDLDKAKAVAETIFESSYKCLAYSNITLAYIKSGKKDSAQRQLQEALEVAGEICYLSPCNYWREKIIRAHLLLNGLDKAKEIASELGNYREIVLAYLEEGKLEEAEKIAHEFFNKQNDSDKYFLLAKIAETYYKQGELEKAKKILNEAKKQAVKLPGGSGNALKKAIIDFSNDEIFNLIASGYVQINELEEAKQLADFIKDKINRRTLLERIALAHIENPYDIQALKESEIIARNAPFHCNISTLKKIALAYLRLNRLEYAQAILNELVEIATDPLEIKEVVSLYIAFNDFDSAIKAANASSIGRIAYEEIVNIIHNSIVKIGEVVSTNRISREERRFVTLNTLR